MKRKLKSIKNRIMFFFIGLSVFQIIVTAGVVKFHLEPSIVNMYRDHLDRFADVTLKQVVAETEKIERYMINIIGDSRIQAFLKEADKTKSSQWSPALSTELRNRILSYTEYDNIIRAIYLMDNHGRVYSNLSPIPMQYFLNDNRGLESRKDATAIWCGEKNSDTIAVYRIINNNTIDLTKKVGALCIFIDKKLFKDRVDQLMMEEGQNYVLEHDENQFNLFTDKEAKIKGGDIVSAKKYENWSLKTWIAKNIAYEPVNMVMRILTIELLLLLVISVVLVIFLSERITRPMRKIEEVMKEIGAGNMDTVIVGEDEDEMGRLAKTLNRMSGNIKELMEQIRKDEDQKRYLELKAMQYQINPHFLYNALDSITMSARKNNDTQSEKMTMALSEFFRISLSHGMEYIPVETEIRYVESYMEIQSMRFPHSVTWECKVEERIRDIKILKFILQPLVENSFYHGIHDAGEKGVIRIHAYAEGNDLKIQVSDNGIGMLPKQLDLLKHKISEKKYTEKSIHEGGFGLQNVQQRLKLVYGETAGLYIESEWEEGTKITVLIPQILDGRREINDES